MSATIPLKSKKETEDEVRSWGFQNVFTWTDRPGAHYEPHSHAGLTTHVILKGELTIAYPTEDKTIKDVLKTTYKAGDRIDVDAGQVHEVWIGGTGCTYVIGE
ncbi:hypothetical protein B0H63DRAFT_444300 [Podospora didyma]|uniref:Uncharacterized protein n=1 Tax=Podospora didyma TaxID=330526 RepID=A0AAE0P6C1_9PEZI|nr:hypothetical protein B0H63DRAFT_444300 [Podospora didyma]